MKKNNLEMRRKGSTYEIVCWYANPYYGRQDEYVLEPDGFYTPPNNPTYRIQAECFESELNCYTVATITAGIPSISQSAVFMDGADSRDFIFMLRSGVKKSLGRH